jgi:hypothetical protein
MQSRRQWHHQGRPQTKRREVEGTDHSQRPNSTSAAPMQAVVPHAAMRGKAAWPPNQTARSRPLPRRWAALGHDSTLRGAPQLATSDFVPSQCPDPQQAGLRKALCVSRFARTFFVQSQGRARAMGRDSQALSAFRRLAARLPAGSASFARRKLGAASEPGCALSERAWASINPETP